MIQPTAKPEDHFEERLAALDEVVSSGQSPLSSLNKAKAGSSGADSATKVSTEIDQRLEKTLPALQLLDKYWRRTRNPSSTGQHKTIIQSPTPHPSRIGKFEILRELGRGGFGVVLLAKDTTLQYEVALKIPHSHALASAELRDRFRREAQVVAKLQHPNIITVHEAGDVGPISYIVYAYCPGQSLAEWLKNRREAMPVRQAAKWVATMADAVAYAHDRGILHRDLKPANVMLSAPSNSPSTEYFALSTLVPMITDFGLAKTLDSSKLTQTGGLLGTPAYMAPEQALKHKDLGPAVDIHALGLILYELLTGRPPFRGESEVETLEMVARQEPVSPRKIRPKLPGDLETICMKCLQKDPDQRYATAQALSADLKRYLDGKHIKARPVGLIEKSWRQCRRHPVVTGLIAALVLLSIVSAIIIEKNSRERLEQAAETRTRFHVAVDGFRQQIAMGRKLLDNPATFATGRELLIKAIDYYDKLLDDAPMGAVMLEEASEYASLAGGLFRGFGQNEEAEKRLLKAQKYNKEAIKIKGENEERVLRLADSLMNLGHLYRHTEREGQAEAAYRESGEVVTRLTQLKNDPVKYQGQFCYAVANQCAVLCDMKRFDEAGKAYEGALEKIDLALEHDSSNRNNHFQKGMLLNDYGAMLFDQKKTTQGEGYLMQALAVRQYFLQTWPKDIRSLKYLANTHIDLSEVCERQGRSAEARSHLEEALQLFEKQLTTFAIIPERLGAFANTHRLLAIYDEKQRNWPSAENHCRTAVTTYGKMCSDYPQLEDAGYARIETRFQLADILSHAGKGNDAKEVSRMAWAEYQECSQRGSTHPKMKALHKTVLQMLLKQLLL